MFNNVYFFPIIFILITFLIIFYIIFDQNMNFEWLVNDNYSRAFLKMFILIVSSLLLINNFRLIVGNLGFNFSKKNNNNYCENFEIIHCPKCITKPCNCRMYMKCGTNEHLQRKCVWKQADR